MKLFLKLLIIFLSLIAYYLSLAPNAFAFDIAVFPDSTTIETKPDRIVSQSLTIENLEASPITVYPVVLSDHVGDEHVLLYNTWVSIPSTITIPGDSEYTLNYTITVPANTYGGEYYYILGTSDSPYTDDESDNPPLVVGHRLTIQVDGSSKPATSGSTSSTSGSGSSGSTSTSEKTSGGPEILTPDRISNLYSNLKVVNFSLFYNPLDQSAQISLRLRNNGNISSVPGGYVVIKKDGWEIEKIPFNAGEPSPVSSSQSLAYRSVEKAVLPFEERSFDLRFKPSESLMGFFEAELFLGSTDSKEDTAPRLVRSGKFFYISTIPLAVVFAALLLLIFIEKTFSTLGKPKARLALRNAGHIFALFIVVISAIYLQRITKIDKKTLGDTVTVTVSASVKKNIIGIKKTTMGGEKALIFRGNTKKGWKIISNKKLLLEGDQISSGGNTLKIGKYRRPILMIHNGF